MKTKTLSHLQNFIGGGAKCHTFSKEGLFRKFFYCATPLFATDKKNSFNSFKSYHSYISACDDQSMKETGGKWHLGTGRHELPAVGFQI